MAAKWGTLKAAVAEVIKTNGNQEITGQLLQDALSNIISTIGNNATFAGIATPDTNPGAPDGPVFYLAAKPGTYSNFGGAVVERDAVIFSWDPAFTAWRLLNIGIINKSAYDTEIKAVNSAIYAYLGLVPSASTYPVLNTADGTLTFKRGSHLFGGNLDITLDEDIVLSNTDSSWSSHYVIINSAKEVRIARTSSIPVLDDGEHIICKVSWRIGIIKSEFFYYYLDGRVIDCKNTGGSLFIDYAIVTGQKPQLDTTTKTLTFPKGTNVTNARTYNYSVGDYITLSSDIVFKAGNYGSVYCVLDCKTQAYRTINTKDNVLLKKDEAVLALVRWTDCIYQGNFVDYYLNGALIKLKGDNAKEDISLLTTLSSAEMASEAYYDLSSYEIGNRILQPIYLKAYAGHVFYNFHFFAKKGDKLVIKGQGGTGSSRLFMFINAITREVTDIAEPAYNALNVPLEFVLKYDAEIYGTSISSLSYVKLYKSPFTQAGTTFNDYLGLVPNPATYPILNTADGTLTFKRGSHFFGSNLDITLDEDIVLSNTDSSWSSHYVIINSAKEVRIVQYRRRFKIADNEGVICAVRWNSCIINSNILTYYLNDKIAHFKPSGTDISAAPKMYNPLLNLQKSQLRVLDIGNSYTEDATHYLPEIVAASGIDTSDMCLYRTFRGGASFKNWYDIYHNQDASTYTISKVVGGLNADISGTAAANNGEKFRNTLTNNEWDLIIIHQVSQYAPYYSRWEENNNAGYLSKLIRLIRKHQPKATIGFLLVHSYWSNYSGNSEKSSLKRWQLIADSAMKLRANYDINFIIPYGTAIQNLRASSLNNDYDLTADGTHCGSGLADYTAACTYFQALFAPRYGKSVLGNTARITVNQSDTYPSVNVTDENAPIAQLAAMSACYNWYECINPETLEDENLI